MEPEQAAPPASCSENMPLRVGMTLIPFSAYYWDLLLGCFAADCTAIEAAAGESGQEFVQSNNGHPKITFWGQGK